MSVRVADRLDDWEQRPFEGGYAALQDLAAEEFSGVVRSGGAELYMTAGTVVGIEHGSIEDFESGSGTVFESPAAALPLLAVMQAADADVRAQYYTEETPIPEVDDTLSDGGFTGFLELSENVLSGDYYQVFHGGRSMAVGFVGASEQLITGDEAYETAADEVGIYKVRQVDVEPIEIPEPSGSDEAAAASEPDESDAPADADEDDAEPAETDVTEAESEPTAAAEAGAAASAEPAEPDADAATDETGTEAEARAAEAESGGTAATEEPSASAGETETVPGSGDRETTAGAETSSTAGAGGRQQSQASQPPAGRQGTGGQTGGARSGSTGGGTQSRGQTGGGGQASDLETRSIPSLDPDMTTSPSPSGGRSSTGNRPTPSPEPASEPARGPEPQQQPAAEPQREPSAAADSAEPPSGESGTRGPELDELESDLAEREAEIERLEAELADAEEDREELEAELEDAIAERDDLAAEVDRLEEELERLESEFGAATDAERRMTPGEAIEGTNLFVDYDSKGDATLEDAHGGAQSREEVAENLQLGVHTEFDDRSVAVGGQAFDEFLRSTLHYRFAEWIVGTLLFEIRDTGHADALTDLYDAIPEIRRVEFNGAIDVEYVEDGQEKGGRERFDVIFRHRMGDPLVVANLNDSRDPATGGMMETLVTSAERVGQTADSLSGAFLVTSSFFESEALETVTEATQGGLLSRDKRKSFVNLSRKQGYHLCLVAAREGNFHMEVPEL